MGWPAIGVFSPTLLGGKVLTKCFQLSSLSASVEKCIDSLARIESSSSTSDSLPTSDSSSTWNSVFVCELSRLLPWSDATWERVWLGLRLERKVFV
jgi:hypothetical protein